jgi:hypothetical protein
MTAQASSFRNRIPSDALENVGVTAHRAAPHDAQIAQQENERSAGQSGASRAESGGFQRCGRSSWMWLTG